MTTLGKQYQRYIIDGKFDDCQRLVKKAFLIDPYIHLSSFICKFNQYRQVSPSVSLLFLCMVKTSDSVDDKGSIQCPFR